MKPLQLTLIALIASLGATAQLAQKFNLALTTKNVWLSPTLIYEVSPTTSLELTQLKTFVERMLVIHAAAQSI